MLVICEKCKKENDVNYDESSGKAVCSACGGSFSVNDFMKKMLIETRSIIREKRRTGFMHPCLNCGTDREVKFVDEKAVCSVCGSYLNVPPAILEALKSGGKTFNVGAEHESSRPSIKFGRSDPKKVVAEGAKKKHPRKTSKRNSGIK